MQLNNISDEKITIIMPVCNGDSTLSEAFFSLENLKHKSLVDKIIIIDDGSKDNSLKLISQFKSINSGYEVLIIKHPKSVGLAGSYNEGIERTSTSLFVVMHQDVVLPDRESIKKIMKPFHESDDVVATFPTTLHPSDVWGTYNFWQKVLFAPLVDRKTDGFINKFDCIRKIEGVKYNNLIYRTAGEDFDYEMNLLGYGRVIHADDLEVIHIHNKNPKFSIYDLCKKKSQLAEDAGVNIRRHFCKIKLDFLALVFLRPFLLAGLVIWPHKINLIFVSMLILYSVLFTRTVYRLEYRNCRVLLLPAINIIIVFLYSYYLLKGIILGKQVL